MRTIRAKEDIRQFNGPPVPFVLHSGWAAQYHDGVDGERQILGIMLPGDVWQGTSTFGIIALTDCTVTYVAASGLHAITANCHGGGVDDLTTTQSWLIVIGTREAPSRIAFLLLHLFARLEKLGLAAERSAEIALTQADMGAMCCLTPVHVNRVLRSFDKAGLIRRKNRRVTLLKQNELVAIARIDKFVSSFQLIATQTLQGSM